MGEFIRCTLCRNDFEAQTEEMTSYNCPKCTKPKGNVKMLDLVMTKNLTGFPLLSESQDPDRTKNLNGVKYDDEETSQ